MEDLSKLQITHGGTPRLFGEYYGKPLDDYKRVIRTRYFAGEDALLLEFETGEVLTVYAPQGVESSDTVFRIRDASRLIWEIPGKVSGAGSGPPVPASDAIPAIVAEYCRAGERARGDACVAGVTVADSRGLRTLDPKDHYAVELF